MIVHELYRRGELARARVAPAAQQSEELGRGMVSLGAVGRPHDERSWE
jgi:hypothetical protein